MKTKKTYYLLISFFVIIIIFNSNIKAEENKGFKIWCIETFEYGEYVYEAYKNITFGIDYVSESNNEDIWQTPEETLSIKQGDCEDYSTSLLSLFLAYNPALNCYNVVLSSHVTTFCKINDYYIYYDQRRTELKKKATTNIPINLHKPWLDDVKIKCSNCNSDMIRIQDIIDVWIDSGTVSWNCLNYPQKKDNFKKY